MTKMREFRPWSERHANGNAFVWRYLPLEKFLDVVINHRLFFARGNLLTDKYEGTLPSWNRSRSTASEGSSLQDQHHEDDQLRRRAAFISCWSKQRHESYALWKIYLGGSPSGVAIKTRVADLRKALGVKGPSDQPLRYTPVSYAMSIPEEHVTPEEILTTKVPYYKYEEELRVFWYEEPGPTGSGSSDERPGEYLPLSMEDLKPTLVISPFAGGWFRDVVKESLEKLYPEWAEAIESSHVRDQ